ncbi:zinc finger CCCH domain-containing protein 3-like [Artemia franciscana]|uniref:C3H1-type domain-containing protein n=1 Tax=Artemia franciscana TaxID=6661 RepID=A0AA88IRX2_ARTSF|nr:hypothetical protein QYM36_000845 [Artemia franciscana]
MLMSPPDTKKVPSRIYINPKFISKSHSSQDPNSLKHHPSLDVMPEINYCLNNPYYVQHWQHNPLHSSQYVSHSHFQNTVPHWNYQLIHPPPPPSEPESENMELFESHQEMAPNSQSEMKEAHRPRKAYINNKKFQSISEEQRRTFQETFVTRSSKSLPPELEYVQITSSNGLETRNNFISQSFGDKEVYRQREACMNAKKFQSFTHKERRAFQEAPVSKSSESMGQSSIGSFKKNQIEQSLLNKSDMINQTRDLTINTSEASNTIRDFNFKKDANSVSLSLVRRQNSFGRGINTRYKIVKSDSKLLAKKQQVQTTLASACHPVTTDSRYKLVRKNKLVPEGYSAVAKVNRHSDGQFEEASTKIPSIPLLSHNSPTNLLSKYRLVNTSSLKSAKPLKQFKLTNMPRIVKTIGVKNSIVKSGASKNERKKVFSAAQKSPLDIKKTKPSISKYKIVRTAQRMPLNIKRQIPSVSKYKIVRTPQRRSSVSKKSPNSLSVISRYKMIRPTITPHLSAFKKDLAHRSMQLKFIQKSPKLVNKGSLRYSVSRTRLRKISVSKPNLAHESRQMSNKMIRKGNVLYSASARQLKRIKSVDVSKVVQVNSSIAVVSRARNRSLATLSSLKKKGTLPCMFLAKFGKCSKQESNQCAYSHSISKMEAKKMMPTCQYFLEGRCRLGKECPFPHVKHGSHTPICLSFISGKCLLGDKCSRRHENVCIEFKSTGKCSQGHKCPLRHIKVIRKPKSVPKRKIVRTKNQEPISAERYFEQSDEKDEDKLSSELKSMRARLLKKIQVMKGEIAQDHPMSVAVTETGGEEAPSRPSLGTLPDFISID